MYFIIGLTVWMRGDNNIIVDQNYQLSKWKSTPVSPQASSALISFSKLNQEHVSPTYYAEDAAISFSCPMASRDVVLTLGSTVFFVVKPTVLLESGHSSFFGTYPNGQFGISDGYATLDAGIYVMHVY
jgi:hypothetical protein